jgi:hypothetical protein
MEILKSKVNDVVVLLVSSTIFLVETSNFHNFETKMMCKSSYGSRFDIIIIGTDHLTVLLI